MPSVENLFKFTKLGFDLVVFSGRKVIRGPQSAGLLLGKRNYIETVGNKEEVEITTWMMMDPGQERIVAQRVKEILENA